MYLYSAFFENFVYYLDVCNSVCSGQGTTLWSQFSYLRLTPAAAGIQIRLATESPQSPQLTFLRKLLACITLVCLFVL